MRRRHSDGRRASNWSRGRMLGLLAVGIVSAGLAVAGLVLAATHRPVRPSLTPQPAGQSNVEAGETERASMSPYDDLAARPMPTFGLAAAQPQAISLHAPGSPLVLPHASAVGDAGVTTGFPHTAEGAAAQLAAIDQVALQSASLDRARDVVTEWAVPGGPDGSSWSVLAALARLLAATEVSSGDGGQVTVVLTPVMGLIKGTVGPDFVVPCIDFEIDVTVTHTARAAIADCARMVWRHDRWLIGPGPEPADPPSLWPDTDLAFSVGYRDVRHG